MALYQLLTSGLKQVLPVLIPFIAKQIQEAKKNTHRSGVDKKQSQQQQVDQLQNLFQSAQENHQKKYKAFEGQLAEMGTKVKELAEHQSRLNLMFWILSVIVILLVGGGVAIFLFSTK